MLKAVFSFLLRRRAGVALIVALSTPLLVATTGLSTDLGYWYQQQESLQSAADAGAIAAATSFAKYNVTSATAAEPFAVAAANNATNNQFGLTSATLTLSAGAATIVNGATVTPLKATAAIPRRSFFSGAYGLGLLPLGAGMQYASATVDVDNAAGQDCLYSSTLIYATGGAKINGNTCDTYSGSTSCTGGDTSAISADPSAQIVSQAITTTGCTYANTSGGAYVGTPAGSSANGANTGYQVTNNSTAQADPLAIAGAPPAWPAMPAAPSTTSSQSATTPSPWGYNNNGSGTYAWGYCGAYNASCYLNASDPPLPTTYTGLSNTNLNNLTLNYTGSTNATYISGGFGGTVNGTISMVGPGGYFINGGLTVADGTAFNIGAVNLDVSGGTTFTNGSISMGAGTDYFTGAVNGAGVATGWGMQINTPNFSFSGGTWYVNGGLNVAGSTPTMTFGQGTYMFSACSGCGAAFVDNTSGNITFTGGTYFFNGGLTVSGQANVTFGPGIYYIENGNLNITGHGTVIANGATFVLEGTAGYTFSGGASATLSAPSTNCVSPSSYPLASYTSSFPYDGTDGEGICGVLIYQQRGDTAADSINEGADATVNGIMYALNAPLTVTGNANYSASANGTFAIIANSVSDTGGGQITLSATSTSGLGGTGTTSVALVN